jgi:hypothetical protein
MLICENMACHNFRACHLKWQHEMTPHMTPSSDNHYSGQRRWQHKLTTTSDDRQVQSGKNSMMTTSSDNNSRLQPIWQHRWQHQVTKTPDYNPYDNNSRWLHQVTTTPDDNAKWQKLYNGNLENNKWQHLKMTTHMAAQDARTSSNNWNWKAKLLLTLCTGSHTVNRYRQGKQKTSTVYSLQYTRYRYVALQRIWLW